MLKIAVLVTLGLIVFSNSAKAELSFKDLGNGWSTLTQNDDPFDKSKFKILQISKEGFTVTCETLIMEVNKSHFEGLSFYASLKYKIDNQTPVDKEGRYSTSPYGSDSTSDSRYYSFYIKEDDISAFKKGTNIHVAGQYSSFGWESKELSLSGFSDSYDQMCGK